jgi:diacylglycerol kinase (ATP)
MSPPKRSPSRVASFHNAFRGFRHVIQTQRNTWIHSAATVLAVGMGIWLEIAWRDWASLCLAIGFVWFAEFMNTALETIVDLASPQLDPLAGLSKDIGAAAVLISATIAVLVGLLILGPPLVAKLLGR